MMVFLQIITGMSKVQYLGQCSWWGAGGASIEYVRQFMSGAWFLLF